MGTSFGGYDPFGRVGFITLADSSTTTFTYTGVSAVSRVQRVWNGKAAESVKTQEFYDRDGNLHVVVEPNGTRTRYNYDVAGRLVAVNQNVGGSVVQERHFWYDGLGYLIMEKHPENGITSYRRDVLGNVTKSVKADGSTLSYRYDAAGRLTSVLSTRVQPNVVLRDYVYNTSGPSKGKLGEEWAYNWRLDGSPAVCTNFKVGERYTYEPVSGLIQRKETLLSRATTPQNTVPLESFDQSYLYDGAGRVKELTYPNCLSSAPAPSPPCPSSIPWKVTTNYSYGRPTSIQGFASNIAYSPNGMIAGVTHTNQVVDSVTLDSSTGMPRPASISATKNNVPLWGPLSYSYDPSGNITAIGTEKYAYDKLSRLVSASIPAAGAYPYRAYEYDVFGNMTGVSWGTGAVDSHGAPVITASAPFTTTASSNRLSLPATYNDRGDLTSYQGSSYNWDRFDNLTTVNTGSETWTHTYDANNERVWSWRTSPSRVDTYALRDLGGNLLRDYKKEGTLFTRTDYVYREGQPLASVDSAGNVRHFHLDHLGSVRRITDGANGVTAHDMWPYGEEYTSQSDAEQMRFTGHERDLGVVSAAGANTGLPTASVDDLDYMHARHYRPLLGRFLSVDRHTGDARIPQSWNRYGYVLGNPLTSIDPDGQQAVAAQTYALIQHELRQVQEGKMSQEQFDRIQGQRLVTAAAVAGAAAGVSGINALATRFPRLFLAGMSVGAGLTGGATPRLVIPGPRNSPYGKLDFLLGLAESQKSIGRGGFFAGKLGFTAETLDTALREQFLANYSGTAAEGERVVIVGELVGPNGVAVVKSIWQVVDGAFEFITAFPAKGGKH